MPGTPWLPDPTSLRLLGFEADAERLTITIATTPEPGRFGLPGHCRSALASKDSSFNTLCGQRYSNVRSG